MMNFWIKSYLLLVFWRTKCRISPLWSAEKSANFGTSTKIKPQLKMNFSTQPRTSLAVSAALAVLFLLFSTGCPSPSPNLPSNNSTDTFPGTKVSYGVNTEIDLTKYGKLLLRDGDMTILAVNGHPGEWQEIDAAGNVNLLRPAGYQSDTLHLRANASNQRNIQMVANSGSLSATYTLDITYGPFIWPGDANGDGRRNMLDLWPIVEHRGLENGMVNGVFSGPSRSQVLDDPADENFVNRLWPATSPINYLSGNPANHFQWNGSPVPASHFDADGNGIVEEADLPYIWANATPMYLPHFLRSQVNPGLKLRAVYGGYTTRLADGKLVVPYDIVLDQLPVGVNSLNISGVIFSRPVTETPDYQVHRIQGDMSKSELFIPDSVSHIIGKPLYHDTVGVSNISGQCGIEAVDKVIDVGVFNSEKRYVGTVGSIALTCLVTLDDIFRVAGTNQGNVPLIFHTYQGIIFVSSGTLAGPQFADCTSDTVLVDPDTLFHADLAICDNADLYVDEFYPHPAKAWATPDIWNRRQQDGLTDWENPVQGTKQYVYNRIRNVGFDDTEPADVAMYWSRTDLGQTWQQNFAGNSNFHAEMPPVSINVLRPFTDTVIAQSWTPGPLQTYSGSMNPDSVFPVISFLTRILSQNDPMANDPTKSPIGFNAQHNNNIAIRNFYDCMDPAHRLSKGSSDILQRYGTVALSSGETEGAFNIVLEKLKGPAGENLTDYGNLLIKFSSDLGITGATPDQLSNVWPRTFRLTNAFRGALNKVSTRDTGHLGVRFDQRESVEKNMSWQYRLYAVNRTKSDTLASVIYEINLQP